MSSGAEPHGYSGTPLVTKLGIKPGMRVALLGAPGGFETELAPLPSGVRLITRLSPRSATGSAVTIVFIQRRAELTRRLPALGRAAQPAGSIWVAWPKKTAAARLGLDCDVLDCDVTDNVIRDVALPLGLVDVKVCALNDVWSGLKLVWRVAQRRTIR